MITKRTRTDSFTTILKTHVMPTREFEVWVLGTWQSDTCHARVVFTGSEEAAIQFRKASPIRSTLSIRPTGSLVDAPPRLLADPALLT